MANISNASLNAYLLRDDDEHGEPAGVFLTDASEEEANDIINTVKEGFENDNVKDLSFIKFFREFLEERALESNDHEHVFVLINDWHDVYF